MLGFSDNYIIKQCQPVNGGPITYYGALDYEYKQTKDEAPKDFYDFLVESTKKIEDKDNAFLRKALGDMSKLQ